MLKNYLKIAIRNLLRHKVYSFINIFGLAVGIGCCILICLYINDELSYDKFHENADRIYRINSELTFGGNAATIPWTSDMMGPILKKDFPQVEAFTRIIGPRMLGTSGKLIKRKDEFIIEKSICYADSTFFDVFTFPVLYGDTKTALSEPNSVVINESIAKKYFGVINAVGRSIETNEKGNAVYKVSAVIKDMPGNSHFKFDFIFPNQNASFYPWQNYMAHNIYTYLRLQKGVNYKEFEKKFDNYILNYLFPFIKQVTHMQSMEDLKKAGNNFAYNLIPLTDIHLHSHTPLELGENGDMRFVYIFAAIALLILLIASINFINLTTAHAANRAREVGIRKVLGTERKNLIFQFLIESFITALLASILALIIIDFMLPFLNSITGKELELSGLFSSSITRLLIILPFIIGLIAGSYPAFYLSKFIPEQVLKGNNYIGNKRKGLRSTLVVFQFVTSIVLIAGTLIIYKQLSYMQNKDLGFKKDVMVIHNTDASNQSIITFKDEMMRIPGVISGTISGYIPAVPTWRNSMQFFKDPTMNAKSGFGMQGWFVDYDYIKTMGMKVLDGRDFSKEFGTDSSAIILNEVAAKQLGYSNPIGQSLYTSFLKPGKITEVKVIGVVKNFNYESLRQEIAPLCLTLGKHTYSSSFKINPANVKYILDRARSIWKNMFPGMQFNYNFIDDSVDGMYKNEQNVGKTALIFTLLAIFIACLGLFGLAAFMTEQRTKEIGIRKVLGASVPTILVMLSKEFLKWVAIANIIAWPLAYYFMNKWLQDFAYRINISIWIFIISGVTAIMIALATVSFQALKAAVADPVKSLKYE